ncbi:glycosyltransferase [Frankia sp. Cppng1_Ct_nod]|uniref:glycosyltransferase n=1 Tax=Frankia sp. Cppng1_Ct_nod TaxID=2897162 RepID=UPI00104195F1|nr:glycosyltransferase [Frankia sp. Cppng1_Ct_nod]
MGHEVERWTVIVEEPFLPADAGGRVETFTFLSAAVAVGIRPQVLVPTPTELDVTAYEDALPGAAVIRLPRRPGPMAHLGPRPFAYASRPVGALRRALTVTPRRADAVISYSCRVAHLGEQIARAWRIPHLVRAHNIDSEYFRILTRSTSGPRSAACAIEYRKLRHAEDALHHSPDVTCIADISVEDHAWRRARCSVRTMHLPPFLPGSVTGGAGATGGAGTDAASGGVPGRLLFVGSLDTPTNIEALRWFLDTCWSSVRVRHPDASLQVVGRRGDPELVAWLRGHSRVSVHTDVPSVSGYVAGASVSLNPMRSGSGVNIKVVEAMAAGVPVVSTQVGGRGLGWTPRRDLLVADDAAGFTDAVCRLLAAPELAGRIGEAGRAFVSRELDPNALVGRIRSALG